MTVPKTAIHKYNSVVTWQDNIRFSGQFTDIQPEPKTLTTQQAANQPFRLGILSLDTCHHATSDNCIPKKGSTGGMYNIEHYTWVDFYYNLYNYGLTIFLKKKCDVNNSKIVYFYSDAAHRSDSINSSIFRPQGSLGASSVGTKI